MVLVLQKGARCGNKSRASTFFKISVQDTFLASCTISLIKFG